MWQLDAPAPTSSVPTTHWEEPEPLRFTVAPPVPAASAAVRAAHASGNGLERAEVWEQAIEATPAERLPELASRQALVEQARGEMDAAKAAGLQASPPGRLVAAEVALVDLKREEGMAMLRGTAQDPQVGSTASAYLNLLTRGGVAADLAEIAALGQFAGLAAVPCDAGEDRLRLASDEVRAEVVALSPVLGRCPDGCQEFEVIQGVDRTIRRFDAEGRPCD